MENFIDESYGLIYTYTKIQCTMGRETKSTNHLKSIHESSGSLSIICGGGGSVQI